jgi:hypothetical protein
LHNEKQNNRFMIKKLSKNQTLRMFDHSTKLYFKIQLSANKNYYEKYVSSDKKNWELMGKLNSFEEVMTTQQELIDNNYKNLFRKLISDMI